MTTRPLTLAQACAQYPNRYTAEHVPAWASKACEGNGLFYAPQFASDVEWYNNTKFHGEVGHVGKKSDCYTSGQTWPFGNWLSAPYVVGATPAKVTNLEASYSVGRKVYDEANPRSRIDVLHEKLRNLHEVLEDDTDFDAWVLDISNNPESAAHSSAVEYLELSENEDDSAKFIAAANELYASDELEFDDTPVVSIGVGGAFVQCWRWVTNEDAGLSDDELDEYTALEVDGEPYEFNVDSVCYKRKDGDFEFWFYHGLVDPTVATITALIRKAKNGEKV